MAALADSVDELLVDGAGGHNWSGGGRRRGEGECAGAVDKRVAGDALARESCKIVGGVGGTDIAGGSDEVELIAADAAAVSVDLVPSAGDIDLSVEDAI